MIRCLRLTLGCLLVSSWGLSQSEAPQKSTAKFSAKVEQVVVYAAVYDNQGDLVPDLGQDEFSIFENRIEQQVTYFGLVDAPSTIGIVLDKSGSMRAKIDLVNQATELFLSLSNPHNELFLVAFDSEASLEESFTRDVADIRDGLDNIVVSGSTALYDAICLAVEQAQEGSEPKRVLLVFTDGEDKDSYYSSQETIEKVREADVQIYLVAFLDEDLDDQSGFFGVFKSDREKISEVMTQVAEDTGGKAFFPEEIEQLRDIFKNIAYELRNQYHLAYASNLPPSDGDWRSIRVRVENAKERGLKVRAKKGYFAKQ